MSNHHLFFYGFLANLITFAGVSIMFIGAFSLLFSKGWGAVLLIVGLGCAYWGKSMRFNYKMNSGYMVHGGDQ